MLSYRYFLCSFVTEVHDFFTYECFFAFCCSSRRSFEYFIALQIYCGVQLMKDIERMRPNPSGTNIISAINLFHRLYGRNDRTKKALFVITQAKFSINMNSIRSRVQAMQRAGTKIYAVGLGNNVDKQQLEALVSRKRDFHLLEPIDHFPLALMTLQFGLLRSKIFYIYLSRRSSTYTS